MRREKVGSGESRDSLLLILDSAAFLEGSNLTPGECVTTPEVLAEVKPGGASGRRMEALLAAGLQVRAAPAKALAQAQKAAQGSGAASRLSMADVSVLALALAEGPPSVLLSDDYTVLDVAARLGIRAQSVTKTGIQAPKEWGARCKGCGRRYGADAAGVPCPICGSEVRLVPAPRSVRK